MREFLDISRDLNLMKLTDSTNGTLYCVPAGPGAPRLIVRHFDGAVAPSLVPAYVCMLAAAKSWLEQDAELAALVRVEQPAEVGHAFIARRHFLGTTLDAFLEADPDEDPPERPPELARMQMRFQDLAARVTGPREQLLATVLARSVLEPSLKTFYDEEHAEFVVGDIKPTPDELERWAVLSSRENLAKDPLS